MEIAPSKQKTRLSVALILCCSTATLYAEPLPFGTVLTIEPGTSDTTSEPCITGSCFGFLVPGGPWIWTNLVPGTDGGLIVGKNQLSGGQDRGLSATNDTSGEMTAAWFFFGAFGTFFTRSDGDNFFDDQSCSDAGCTGKTLISSLDIAWNGGVSSMGESSCCTYGTWPIEWIVNADGTYSLDYTNEGSGGGFVAPPRVRFILRGEIQPGFITFTPPVAAPVSIETTAGLITEWLPDVSGATGYPKNCFIESPPTHGVATVDPSCIFGTYQADVDYAGTDSFTYTVASGFASDTATVSANVSDAVCELLYPAQHFSSNGGGQSSVINWELNTWFSGHLTTQEGLRTGTKNKASICPGTELRYSANALYPLLEKPTCSINGVLAGERGTLKVGDKLVCSVRPEGNDVDRFSVVSGF